MIYYTFLMLLLLAAILLLIEFFASVTSKQFFRWIIERKRGAGVEFKGTRAILALDKKLGVSVTANLNLECEIALPGVPALKYSLKTNAAGERVTGQKLHHPGKPHLLVAGCSFTFGTALSDSQTYPWLLQERFPQFEVRNLGVPSYSPYQILKRLEQDVDSRTELIVVGYHSWLDKRNAGRVLNKRGAVSPYCRVGKNPEGKICLRESPAVLPDGVILRNSQAARFRRYLFAEASIRLRSWRYDCQEATRIVLLKTKELAERNGAKLIIAVLSKSNPHIEFMENYGIPYCGIPFVLTEQNSSGEYKWLLRPYDPHPNARANLEYATTIGDSIDMVLSGNARVAAGVQDSIIEKPQSYIYPLF